MGKIINLDNKKENKNKRFKLPIWCWILIAIVIVAIIIAIIISIVYYNRNNKKENFEDLNGSKAIINGDSVDCCIELDYLDSYINTSLQLNDQEKIYTDCTKNSYNTYDKNNKYLK